MRLFTETWLSTGIRRVCVSSILLGAALLTPPAIAQTTGLIDATKPERILEFAKSFGTAELEHGKSGDPRITGRMEGKRYSIIFYGCKQNVNCTDIQFWAYWPASQSPGLPAINTWHQRKKFGTAYLDTDGDLILQLAVNIEYGVSSKNLEDSFMWWQIALRNFMKEVVQPD